MSILGFTKRPSVIKLVDNAVHEKERFLDIVAKSSSGKSFWIGDVDIGNYDLIKFEPIPKLFPDLSHKCEYCSMPVENITCDGCGAPRGQMR